MAIHALSGTNDGRGVRHKNPPSPKPARTSALLDTVPPLG